MASSGLVQNQGVDSLSPSSRILYERAVFKLVLSFLYAGLALMFLGFTSTAGGQSASAGK